MYTDTSDLLKSIQERQESSRRAFKDKRKAQAMQMGALSPQGHGDINVQRTIQTGHVTGSDAFRKSPEDIVVGEGKPWEKRTDFQLVGRQEKPAPEDG